MKSEVMVILGPTASGKTDYALQLAQKIGGAVISADSRQVYASMNIGTAKPHDAWSDMPHPVMTPDSVHGIDHYLFNIAEPDQTLTLADWQTAAQKVITKLLSENITPLLVGGTMLYIDSIIRNYSIPEVKPNPELRTELEKLETKKLFSRLITLDPEARKFVEAHHKQRIIRALEVMAATSQPFSQQRQKRKSDYQFNVIGIFPGWELLEQRIAARARQMLDDGLVDEVKNLRKKCLPDSPLLKTINYQQVGNALDRKISEAGALKKMVQVNMRYTHRQMSWWKRNKKISWICAT